MAHSLHLHRKSPRTCAMFKSPRHTGNPATCPPAGAQCERSGELRHHRHHRNHQIRALRREAPDMEATFQGIKENPTGFYPLVN